jgi:hypothetical protein
MAGLHHPSRRGASRISGKIVQARIERTFAWTARCRRLVRDHEATPSSAIAFFILAAAAVLLRRLAKAA